MSIVVRFSIALCVAISLVSSSARAVPPGDASLDAFARLVERQPHGPSFDCSRAGLKTVERRICANARLGRLDQELNDIYGEVLLDSFHALSLAAGESAWLRERDRCTTDACISRAVAKRLEALVRERAEIGRRISAVDHDRGDVPRFVSSALRARLARMAGTSCFGIDGSIDVGDGRTSLLAHTCGDCLPTDHVLIFHPERGSYRLIFREGQCYVTGLFVGFEDERVHGLRRIRTFSRGAAGDHEMTFYDYDGRVYRYIGYVEQFAVQHGHKHAVAR